MSGSAEKYIAVQDARFLPVAADPLALALYGTNPGTGAVEQTSVSAIRGAVTQGGTPGAKGDKGDTGSPGAPGTAGATGATGSPGTNGPPGAPGAKGDKGDTGLTGPTGPAGSGTGGGDVGPQGPQGIQGAQGPPGATGAPGAPGAKGDTGDVGPAGAAGDPLPVILQLLDIDPSLLVDGAAPLTLEDGSVVSLEGGRLSFAGPPGTDGADGPSGSTGANGPPGDAGPAGAAGPAGSTGPIGATGPAGPTGPAGSGGGGVSPIILSGGWIDPPSYNAASATLAPDTLYLSPFEIRTPCTLQQLAVRITTGQAASNMKMGIYRWSGTEFSLSREISADVSTVTAGIVVGTLASNLVISAPELLWFGAVFSSNPLAICWAHAAHRGGGMTSFITTPDPLTTTGVSTAAGLARIARTTSLTYSAGAAFFPATIAYSDLTFSGVSPGSPLIFARAA